MAGEKLGLCPSLRWRADMEEFVIVVCGGSRDVLVDGAPGGHTNVVIIVGTGFHRFSVPGCQPPLIEVNVIGTSPANPMRIAFHCPELI
jgi:hypothetical protein